MVMLSERYFGELEGYDEAILREHFFTKTFVVPNSISMEALRNNNKFIIIGRKGTGKSTVQMHLARQVTAKGYLVHNFRFFNDLRSDDYKDIVGTQSGISYSKITNDKSLFMHYDFRDVWERVFFQKIATTLTDAGHSNKFTAFIQPKNSIISNIFEGISKSLTVKVMPNMGPVAAEIGIDLSSLAQNKDEIPLKTYNKICRALLKEACIQFQMYFFVDELVFSRLDAKEDEVTLRAAMVRDVVRTVWELNNYCYQNMLEFHFICSVRPEIRNLINDLDSESGKFLDGKDVELSWITTSNDSDFLLLDVLQKKVEFSHFHPTDFEAFFAQEISFSGRTYSLKDFLKTNTWGRPRDVVRLLLAIQKKSPNALEINEASLKAGLDEYSRMSLKELIDEIAVTYGSVIVDILKYKVRKKIYKDVQEFVSAIGVAGKGINGERLVRELFSLGFIGGFQPGSGNYYWAHRGESYLKPEHKIMIHAGLWNELSIR